MNGEMVSVTCRLVVREPKRVFKHRALWIAFIHLSVSFTSLFSVVNADSFCVKANFQLLFIVFLAGLQIHLPVNWLPDVLLDFLVEFNRNTFWLVSVPLTSKDFFNSILKS